MYSTRPLSSASTDPLLVDTSLICAEPASEGEDAVFGFDEGFVLSLPQAAIAGSAAACGVGWTSRRAIMTPPSVPVVRVTVTSTFTLPQLVHIDYPFCRNE